MSFLTGYKTYIIGALEFIGGIAIAVYFPDVTLKGLGVIIALQGLTAITLRLGIGEKVDEAKIVNDLIAWLKVYKK
jgi:hypothetical protein